jgi:hypothetical protein
VFNKLFSKILDSSIWLEPTTTRIVWITLLAAMDEDGYAHFSALQNLADRARVSLEEVEEAVKCFESPDENSGNPDNEGRRIERVPGGFLVLNAAYHRDMMNRVIQREKTRVRVAEWRKGKGKPEEKKEATNFKVPAIEEVKLLFAKGGGSETEAEKFWHHYNSKGWLVGKSKMRSVSSAAAGWIMRSKEGTYGNTGSKNVGKVNPRLIGVTRGSTDYGEAIKRKSAKGVVEQMAENELKSSPNKGA